MVVAAHPVEPNQIALGMSDGKVHVVEPLDADPKWGTAPPQDNGAHPAISAAPSAAATRHLISRQGDSVSALRFISAKNGRTCRR